MKIIFSRKGFDSENGGYPSPIMPDGKLVSLPIPSEVDDNRYSDLMLQDGSSYCDIMRQLKPSVKVNKEWTDLTSDTHCHVDPDIFESILPRKAGWKASFGQIAAAQSHLKNMDVNIGDVFLFFGWFQRTMRVNGRIVFDGKAQNQHIIFGYLQIGKIIQPEVDIDFPEWLCSHPHLAYVENPTNTIYTARDRLTWSEKCAGAGFFSFRKDLVLTKEGLEFSRSKWDLPKIFKKSNISYHSQASWKNNYFQSVGRGQEFVVNCTQEIEDWAKHLIDTHASH